MQHVKHIIWDWNGTLLDDTRACLNSVNKMLADRELAQLSIEQYRDLFGFPVSDFYHKIGFVLENEDWDAMAAEFHAMFLLDSSISLHCDTRLTLEALQKRGILQSVLSASEQSILDAMLQEYQLAPYFEKTMGVHNLYGDSKMARGRELVEKIALPRSEILMIGDSLHDYEVAGDLDINCVLIAQGHQSFERLCTCDVPVVRSLSQVLDLIGGDSLCSVSCGM